MFDKLCRDPTEIQRSCRGPTELSEVRTAAPQTQSTCSVPPTCAEHSSQQGTGEQGARRPTAHASPNAEPRFVNSDRILADDASDTCGT